jgi:hypothetical protein
LVSAFELRRLLDGLRGTRSPVARLRFIAGAWKSLRRTTPEERARLATELGVDGAEEIVERLAGARGAHVPKALHEALESLRHTDAGGLRGVLTKLRDADGRRGLVKEGLQVLEEHVLDEEAGDGAQPAPAPAASTAARDRPGGEATRLAVRSPAPQPSVAVVAPRGAATHVDAKAEVAQHEAEPPKPARVTSPDRPKPASPRKPARAASTPTARRPPAAVAPAKGGEEAGWVSALGAIERPAERLRDLRRRGGDVGDLSESMLLDLVDLFPDGWQRRRAVSHLLEEPALDNEAALDAIERLSRERDRVWCLSRLLDGRSITTQQRQRCIGLVASRAARARLARRESRCVILREAADRAGNHR